MTLQSIQTNAWSACQQISQWSFSKTFKRALTVSLVALAAIQAQSLWQSESFQTRDCFSVNNCPDIDLDKIHPREKEAIKAIKNFNKEKYISGENSYFPPEWRSPEKILSFGVDDTRDMVLFVSAESDHNGALNATIIGDILGPISFFFNSKFFVTDRHQDIGRLVQSAIKVSKLAPAKQLHVIISGHGKPSGITFDANYIKEGGETFVEYIDRMTDESDLANYFSGINGRIVLISCSTGKAQSGRPFDNIAQKMADATKRTVNAPIDLVYPAFTELLLEGDVLMHHPEVYKITRDRLFLYHGKNLFKTFRPNFKDCLLIDESELYKREVIATRVIKEELTSKSLLHDHKRFNRNQYRQVCRDDPRDQVLFFSALESRNKALEPSTNSKILGILADSSGLLYKVVESFDEICHIVRDTAKVVKIKNIFIQAHGSPKSGVILSSKYGKAKIDDSSDFSCLSKIDKDGTIVLMGGSLGKKPNSKTDSLAQKIADKSKRRVVASTDPISFGNVMITSINPLILEERSTCSKISKLFGCTESDLNHFQVFQPQTKKT